MGRGNSVSGGGNKEPLTVQWVKMPLLPSGEEPSTRFLEFGLYWAILATSFGK